MARLEAYGTTAQKVGSETISKLESFLGIPDRSLPKDSVDNTFAANGSAFKLKVSVQAGDEISLDWMFDTREFVNSPPDGKADNDFAVFTVATIGFGVVNDRIADSPREQNSFLLVDNVRLNRDFGHSYQLADHQADGRFETVVHK